MIYHFKGNKIKEGYNVDLDDTLLKNFENEMGTISQDMIETCMKLALVRYNDIGTIADLKRRIEDVMSVEMINHKNQKVRTDVIADQKYQLLGYTISVPAKILKNYQEIFISTLSVSKLECYTYIATQSHIKDVNITNEMMQQYVIDEINEEISLYD